MGDKKKKERVWRKLPDDRRAKERTAEYRVACERIGQYDGYTTAYNRVYIGILTAAILARYYCTTLSGWTIFWAGGLAFTVLHLAVAVIRSVNRQFIEYCADYWTEKPKLNRSLAQYMERTGAGTLDDLWEYLKLSFRVRPLAPTVGCVLLLIAGLLLIEPKAERAEAVEAREVTARVFQVEQVIDGDTFVVQYDGEPTPVRIVGIDAPDVKAEGGAKSRAALQALILRKDVRLQFIAKRKRDSRGWLVARVLDGEKNIGDAMLTAGNASPNKE